MHGSFRSRYLDIPNEPLFYPFGYGLSYTEFEISAPELTADTAAADGSLEASVTVTNKGTARERKHCGSISRMSLPVWYGGEGTERVPESYAGTGRKQKRNVPHR